jgi:hypothetical protein
MVPVIGLVGEVEFIVEADVLPVGFPSVDLTFKIACKFFSLSRRKILIF